MRSRILSTLIGAVAVIVGVQADAQSQAKGPKAQPDYSLTISSKRSEFAAGEEIRIEILRRNVSGHALNTAVTVNSDAEMFYMAEVFDEKGDAAIETRLRRQIRTGEREPNKMDVSSGVPAMLQPGATIRERIVLNRLFDMSQPGKYAVDIKFNDDQARVAKSNTLSLTITK